jgi:hypothetical protein
VEKIDIRKKMLYEFLSIRVKVNEMKRPGGFDGTKNEGD